MEQLVFSHYLRPWIKISADAGSYRPIWTGIDHDRGDILVRYRFETAKEILHHIGRQLTDKKKKNSFSVVFFFFFHFNYWLCLGGGLLYENS